MKLTSIFESISKQSINELDVDRHSLDRIIKRFVKQTYFPLILKSKSDKDYGRQVGTYKISDDESQKIFRVLDEIMNLVLPKDVKLGVVVHKFDLLRNENIMWPNNDIKLQALRDVVHNDARLYIQDVETDSIGDVFYLVLNGNKVVTMFYNRSHTMKIDDRIDAIVDADMLYTYATRGVKDTGNVWSQLRNPTKS
jgi:predicted solute-binding protein